MTEKDLQNLKLELDQLLVDFNTQKQTIQTLKSDKADQKLRIDNLQGQLQQIKNSTDEQIKTLKQQLQEENDNHAKTEQDKLKTIESLNKLHQDYSDLQQDFDNLQKINNQLSKQMVQEQQNLITSNEKILNIQNQMIHLQNNPTTTINIPQNTNANIQNTLTNKRLNMNTTQPTFSGNKNENINDWLNIVIYATSKHSARRLRFDGFFILTFKCITVLVLHSLIKSKLGSI